jgi:hypothetical protein
MLINMVIETSPIISFKSKIFLANPLDAAEPRESYPQRDTTETPVA